MFEWLTPDEIPPTICLIVILNYFGDQMMRGGFDSIRLRTKQLAALAFVASAIIGIVQYQAFTVSGILLIVFQALLFAGLVAGVTKIGATLGSVLYKEFRPEAPPKEIESIPEQPIAPPMPKEQLPEPIPPPTREEKADEALKRYEEK